jgi:hypothetical protein
MKATIHTFSLCLIMLLGSFWGGQELQARTQRYRIMWHNDPATSVTIGWQRVSGKRQRLYIGLKDYGQDTSRYERVRPPVITTEYRDMRNQFVRLRGLRPNTEYFFVIGDNEGVSERFWFRTAPNISSIRLSFIAGGDSRNNREPRQNANRLVAKLKPLAVLFDGDMTDDDTFEEWADWFDDWQLTIGRDGRMTPIVVARGNHERTAETLPKLFDSPEEGYYAFNIGGDLMRFYTLNTEVSINGNQLDWLEYDLAHHCNVTWRMAQYHKPIRPHIQRKREGSNQYIYWSPLFYQYNFNLVIEGDAHTAKLTWPIRPGQGPKSDEGFIRDDLYGTVYVGEGCWGAPLRETDDIKSWTRSHGTFNQLKWIFVDREKIEVRTIKVGNKEETFWVEEVSLDDPFTPPANLNIWKPKEGAVVTIRKPPMQIEMTSPIPDRHFPMLPQQLKLKAKVLKSAAPVVRMSFLMNGSLLVDDNKAPYELNWTLNNPGAYQLQAVAWDAKGNRSFSCPVTVTADNTHLPREWTLFEVDELNKETVEIRWATQDGLSHLTYLLERAGTDQNFKVIHEQAYLGKNLRGVRYRHVDEDPLPGLSYYRIRAIDELGSYQFTNTLEVTRAGESVSSFKALPSPVGFDRWLSIEFFSVKKQQVSFSLFNSEGRQMVALEKEMQKGKNWLQLKPGPIPAGIYYLKVIRGVEVDVQKVIFE